MLLTILLTGLSVLALILLFWQWLVGQRFPLHKRVENAGFFPGLTLLKPIKGCDEHTRECICSWFDQDYEGPFQLLFGAASSDDPACAIVRELMKRYPSVQAELVICENLQGGNAKVAKLAQLQSRAAHDVFVISDADVFAPPDLLANLVPKLQDPATGVVNCFYEMADSSSLAMRWESMGTNADFWSQVLQSNTLKPMDFALGAVMAVPRRALQGVGGFTALAECLADDYQLGNRIARNRFKVELCPVVVQCRGDAGGWADAWKHQLRWARTIRVCQPVPYFFSILGNATLWPLLLVVARPFQETLILAACVLTARALIALDLRRRLERSNLRLLDAPIVWLKDILQVAVWLCAFLGNTVEWRGRKMKLRKDGTVHAYALR